MKCTILGAGSGLPHPDYNLSSILVETAEGKFLVDCGEGTSRQLIRNGFDPNSIDAILISHYHPDHISGIYMLLQMLYLKGRTKPLNLFLPERLAAFLDTMHMFYTFEQRFPFVLKLYEAQEIELFYSSVFAALTDHLSGYEEFISSQNYPNMMQSYGFVFQEEEKSFVYTSDISTFANLQNYMEKADLIIMDGLHPDADLIISFAANYPNRLIITHGLSDKLEQWLGNNQNPRIEPARENSVYEV